MEIKKGDAVAAIQTMQMVECAMYGADLIDAMEHLHLCDMLQKLQRRAEKSTQEVFECED